MENKLIRNIVIAVIVVLFLGVFSLFSEVNKLKGQMNQLSGRPSARLAVNKPQHFPQAPQVHSRSIGQFDQDFFGSDVSRDLYREMEQMQRQMDRMMREASLTEPLQQKSLVMQNTIRFGTDIKEDKDKYVLKMDIPGMKKEDINVEIKNNMLLVSGQRHQDEQEKGANYARQERSFGYFSQTLPLAPDADIKAISVNYEQGVLIVEIPRLAGKQKAQEPIKIKVN